MARHEAEFGAPPGEMTEWPPEIDRNDVGGWISRGGSRRSVRRLEETSWR